MSVNHRHDAVVLHSALIRRPPPGVCSVKGCWTAVSVVLLVYCNCCLGATNPGRPKPLIPLRRGRLYLRGQMATICPPLLCSCYRPAAGATLQGLCRKGYAAHAPTAALATQIGMLQLLHWPHRSACSSCCTGHTDQHAPSVALATQFSTCLLYTSPSPRD